MLLSQTKENPKTPLCELFFKWGSDKCPQIYHSYSERYYDILKKHKYDFKNIIEIGIGSEEIMRPIVGEKYTIGASLRAWRDFFPQAFIYGLDIETRYFFEDERIKCFYTDQSDENELEKTIIEIQKINNHSGFDLIVDDGGHIVSDMVLSFKTLFKHIRSNGLYIIEDIKKQDIEIFENLDLQGGEIIEFFHGNFDWDLLL